MTLSHMQNRRRVDPWVDPETECLSPTVNRLDKWWPGIPSVSLVANAEPLYRVQPVGRWQILARHCSEREAHERFEHQMIAFFRLSGGLTEDMKHEPWYIRGLKAEPHDR